MFRNCWTDLIKRGRMVHLLTYEAKCSNTNSKVVGRVRQREGLLLNLLNFLLRDFSILISAMLGDLFMPTGFAFHPQQSVDASMMCWTLKYKRWKFVAGTICRSEPPSRGCQSGALSVEMQRHTIIPSSPSKPSVATYYPPFLTRVHWRLQRLKFLSVVFLIWMKDI